MKNKNLTGADLSGADLRGADLRGADLSETKGIEIFDIDPRYPTDGYQLVKWSGGWFPGADPFPVAKRLSITGGLNRIIHPKSGGFTSKLFNRMIIRGPDVRNYFGRLPVEISKLVYV